MFVARKGMESVTTRSTRRLFSASSEKVWKVYLSGEIHSDWRDVIAKGVDEKQLPVVLTSPNTSHEDSDDCGAIILGMEKERKNWDFIGARMNGVRTKTGAKFDEQMTVSSVMYCQAQFEVTHVYV
jgi:hypothetical protein